jgi:hypothetical protein
MALTDRIAERQHVTPTPASTRHTPRWIRLLTERQMRGEDGFTVQEYTFEVMPSLRATDA